MTEREDDAPDPRSVAVLCNSCGGEGFTFEPKFALLSGVAQTVMTRQACKWCTEGRRRFRAPV
ncbi:hypothetical protein ABZ863_05475 [Saccharomonospora sp. NPDC046836]|uniref:hypothetical protein n=1 Tax=Saccharomonospora sp. NPDC046836 TaxID=3156921 RepID=UPI003400D2CB